MVAEAMILIMEEIRNGIGKSCPRESIPPAKTSTTLISAEGSEKEIFLFVTSNLSLMPSLAKHPLQFGKHQLRLLI